MHCLVVGFWLGFCFSGVSFHRVCLLVALFFTTLRPIPPLGLFSDELPRDADPVSPEVFAEPGGAAVGNEDHGHDLLLSNVVKVALFRDVQDTVRVLDHGLAAFLW